MTCPSCSVKVHAASTPGKCQRLLTPTQLSKGYRQISLLCNPSLGTRTSRSVPARHGQLSELGNPSVEVRTHCAVLGEQGKFLLLEVHQWVPEPALLSQEGAGN